MWVLQEGTILPDHPNCKIWRYMDLSKFLSVLEYRKLYFTRIDKFEDPFEGNWPYIDEAIVEEEDKGHSHAIIGIAKVMRENFNKTRFVNCWHINDEESMAMWKIYSRFNEGIAIVSTFDRLKMSITDKHAVYIGKVKYDRKKVSPAINKVLYETPFDKRPNFEYEKELRAVCDTSDYLSNDGNRDGIGVKNIFGFGIEIDVNELINEVIISPIAEEWFVGLVRDIVSKRYGFKFNVRKSNLLDLPVR